MYLPNVKKCNSENMLKTVKLDLNVWDHNNDLHIEYNFVSDSLSSRDKRYFFIPESCSGSPSGSMYGLFVMYPEVAHSSEGDGVQHQLSLAFPVFGAQLLPEPILRDYSEDAFFQSFFLNGLLPSIHNLWHCVTSSILVHVSNTFYVLSKIYTMHIFSNI